MVLGSDAGYTLSESVLSPFSLIPTSSTLVSVGTQTTDNAEAVDVGIQVDGESICRKPPLLLAQTSLTSAARYRTALPSPQDRGRSVRPGRIRLSSSKLCVPDYAETPEMHLIPVLKAILKHINAAGEGCCNYHVACARVGRAVKKMQASPCLPHFE